MSPRLARTISILCLLLASASAFGALSSEFAVSDIVLRPAELTQRDAVAATDGTDYFSAWVDDRPGRVEGSIRYTVVRATGEIVFPLGQVLETILGAYPVAAVWRDDQYVLFMDGSIGGSVATFDRNGVLTRPPFRLLADGERILSVATNGETIAVLAAGGPENNRTLSVTTLDRNLERIRETRLPIPQPTDEVIGAIAANDDEYGVVWGTRPQNSSTWSVATIHLDSNGGLLDAAGKPVGTVIGLVFPRIDSNDNGYLVSIGEFDGSTRVTTVFALNDDATVITSRVQIGAGLSTGLLWSDGVYLVPLFDVTLQTSDITIYRVNPLAQIIGSRVLTAARSEQSFPVGASRPERVFWAWNDGRRTPGQARDVYFTFTDTNGVPLEDTDLERGVSITYSAPTQSNPHAAFDGTNYLVAWLEAPNDENIFQVFVGRVSGNGAALDGGGKLLSESAGTQSSPRVAFDGTNYVVIYREGTAFSSKLYAVRVGTDGEIVDNGPVEIADVFGGSSYAAASNGAATVVVFGNPLFATDNEIRMASITKSGQVVDRGGRLVQKITANPTVDIATDGQDYLIAWSTAQTGVSALRVLGNGTIEAKHDISPVGASPSVAYGGGGQYLVAWSRPAGGVQQIRGRLVNLQGAPTSAPEQILAQRSALPPTGAQAFEVAFDGTRYGLAWTDPDFSNHPHDPTSDLRGRQILRDGTPLGTVEGIFISATPGEDSEPTVAPGFNRVLIVYSRVAPEATGVRRLFGRFLTTEEFPRQRPAKRP